MIKKHPQYSVRSLVFASLSFSVLTFSSCFLFDQPNQKPPSSNTNEETFSILSENVDLTKPLEISKEPRDVRRCDRIKETIERSEFANARWGVIAIRLNDGRVSCGRDAQKLFNPASIHKILTSIVALDKLGEDFEWKTSVYSSGKIKDEMLDGNLVLYGRGAPDLNDDGLKDLVAQLKQKGIKRISGDVIGDESFFTGDALGDGWTWNAVQWYYGAAASALSINRNQITVTLIDGKPKTDSKYVELSGEVRPLEDIEAIGVKRKLGTNKVYVWGDGKNLNAKIAINKPALLSAKILKELIEKNGITVDGEPRSVDWMSPDKLDVQKATEIASIKSEKLSETIRKMNKDSVNLYAELILRTLGKEFGGEAPDDDPKFQKLRGDDLAGASVVEKWLRDKNISSDRIAIHDGSGLSRLNLVTPEAIVRALVFASQSAFAKTFKNSLPISGRSGTLRNRLKNVSGKILGKTGSIIYVNSLAGYAKSKNETYAFVVVCNNQTHSLSSSKTIDAIATLLAQD